MDWKLALITSLISLCSLSAWAEPRMLNLEQALELAFENSETLRIRALEIGQSDDQISEAMSGALPQVSTSLNYTRYLDSPVIPVGGMEIPIKRNWDLTFEAKVSQVLWSFGRVSNAIEAAKLFRRLSELNLEQARNEIASQVKSLYFSAVMAEKMLTIVDESYQNARRNQQSLRRRFSTGRVPQYDNLKMETDLALRLPQVIEAEQELANIKTNLKFLLGLPQDQDIKIVSNWPQRERLTQTDNVIQQSLSNNLQLKALNQQMSLAEKQTQNERASRYPVIAAFGLYQQAGTGDRYYIGGDNLYPTTAIGIQINYDIWSGGRRSAKISSSEKSESVVRENISQLQRKIRSDIIQISNNLQNIERNLAASQKAQSLAKDAYEMTRTRYESGQASQTELNDAELNLTRARINTEMMIFNQQMEWVKLEQLLARIN